MLLVTASGRVEERDESSGIKKVANCTESTREFCRTWSSLSQMEPRPGEFGRGGTIERGSGVARSTLRTRLQIKVKSRGTVAPSDNTDGE